MNVASVASVVLSNSLYSGKSNILEVNVVVTFRGGVMTKGGTFSSKGFSTRDVHLKLMHEMKH